MGFVICTLFEGNYHYGVAVLINSLYQKGYRGDVFAGYRGAIPPWAASAKENPSLQWKNARTFEVETDLKLHFLPLETDYHLTNYKPDFMLGLWHGPAAKALGIFYFDPDIIVTRNWTLFEEWINCGVALSEDVNSPLSELHPRRVAWRRYFGNMDIQLQFKDQIYVNGGFIGLAKSDIDFLEFWKKIQEAMAPEIGGLNRSIFKAEDLKMLEQSGGGPFMPFLKTDQDALNATIEAGENKISYLGKEGMSFGNGFHMMRHALGAPKPWDWSFFRQTLIGVPPRKVDIDYWKLAGFPIQAYKPGKINLKKLAIKLSLAVGRFYRKT